LFPQAFVVVRQYDFVVNVTPDIEDYQYKLRAIDFDQQSYEGRKNLYLPQFYKDNLPFVQNTLAHLDKESILQYQTEERTLMASRVAIARYRLMQLFNIMCKDEISTPEKVDQLKNELAEYFKNDRYLECHSMGEIVKTNLKQNLRKNLSLIQEMKGKLIQKHI